MIMARRDIIQLAAIMARLKVCSFPLALAYRVASIHKTLYDTVALYSEAMAAKGAVKEYADKHDALLARFAKRDDKGNPAARYVGGQVFFDIEESRMADFKIAELALSEECGGPALQVQIAEHLRAVEEFMGASEEVSISGFLKDSDIAVIEEYRDKSGKPLTFEGNEAELLMLLKG